MSSYESLAEVIGEGLDLTHKAVFQVAREEFYRERGYYPNQSLPDSSTEFEFNLHKFSGCIDPDRRTLDNLTYNQNPAVLSTVSGYPDKFDNLCSDVRSLWYDEFGEFSQERSQPSHPGEVPTDEIEDEFESALEKMVMVKQDPSLLDFVRAIEDKNYTVAAEMLDINPLDLYNPGGHELSEMFVNGDVHVVYMDERNQIALIKPEYNHEILLDVLRQQSWGNFRYTGEPAEPAFVVGIDDTPTGLFGHVVDGTNLEFDQEVTRDMIHDVMGFDRSIKANGEEISQKGERIRLQGDLAIVQEEKSRLREEGGQCNLPVDNHLCIVADGMAVGDTSQAPVRFRAASHTNLEVFHDEHDHVSVNLVPGKYRLYLLDRGIKEGEDRPTW